MPYNMRSELLMALVLMPLAVTDLAAEVSPMITASDASLTGGAVSHSSLLSPCAPASLPVASAGRAPGIVVEIGDTMGALRIALEQSNFTTLAHGCAAATPEASRVLTYAFPDARPLEPCVQQLWWWCQEHGRAEVVCILLHNNFAHWLAPLLQLLHYLPSAVHWEFLIQTNTAVRPLSLSNYRGVWEWKQDQYYHAFSSRANAPLESSSLPSTSATAHASEDLER